MTQQQNLRLALRGLNRKQKWVHETSYYGTRSMRPARQYYHRKQPNAMWHLAFMTGLVLAVATVYFVDIMIKFNQ
jgi:hypothetical protein